jgi:hypothetical protein
MWKDINEEFDKSTSNAYTRVRSTTKQKAIGKTESTLDILIEALAGAKPKDKKGIDDRITTARKKFNLELDNFNRWESSMRDWRRKNPDAEPEAIQKEGIRSWVTDFATDNLETLKERTRETTTEIKGELFPGLKALGVGIPKDDKPKKKVKKPPVRMMNPNGKTGTIPADQVKRAIEKGWKKI